MGPGRRTQSFHLHEGSKSFPASVNCSVSARQLKKADLGGVIFGCKHNTIDECLRGLLFGLPAPHFSYVKNIGPGLPLFLFNYSDRKLHGIFESAGTGQMNINPYGWTENGSERTPYPAQVRVRIRMLCQPLQEKQFKPIICDNFYTNNHFWFELDHFQVERLISLFTSVSSVVPKVKISHHLSSKGPQMENAAAASYLSTRVKPTSHSKVGSRSSSECVQVNQFQALSCDDDCNEEESSSYMISAGHGIESNLLDCNCDPTDPADLANALSGCSISIPCSGGDGETLEACALELKEKGESILSPGISLPVANDENSDPFQAGRSPDQNIRQDDEQLVTSVNISHLKEGAIMPISSDLLEKSQLRRCMEEMKSFEMEQFQNESSDVFCPPENMDRLHNESSGARSPCESIHQDDEQIVLSSNISHSKEGAIMPISPDLHLEISQLKQRIEAMKSFQMKQFQWNRHLEEKLIKSDAEILRLRSYISELESRLEPYPEGSIFLIGGFDGTSFIDRLDSFSPSNDKVTTLKSMSVARSYASAISLEGYIFVIGGGINGDMWFDTVECYIPRMNVWTTCPPLIKKKGSLAGASVRGKLFAIGGGNGDESFSDVEMFDPVLERWINVASMFDQRFAPAAAELNGAIYAIGGYDGKKYLNSVERFDPREASWARVPSMSSRRGCSSLATLNEKLYAIGGFDGEQMVNSVEIFDARNGSWMAGDPFSCSRGYGAAAVLRHSIFLIGGVEDDNNLLDTVECYQEGVGWKTTNLKSVGRRCFLSAAVV